ncbi:VOC family protein [Enhygromyxa salina]|uniref:Glyoxalase-like domain protein n=1 Tax=Enhygromyxa salina TaxID=215803 RepID=A0A2S9XTR9_9BACT|nr:VOC family protein [Enhygromyxa salina]PRP96277.1 Glyoxalase-like domain protein [Enhygromyxa salina]
MTTKLQNPTKLLPLFITTKLGETKAFYVDKLGWTATRDTPEYLQVRSDDREGPEISFMTPDAGPDPLPSFEGRGVIDSVPVVNSDEHYASVQARAVAPASDPSLKPWGWRSYAVAPSAHAPA